MVRWTLVLVVLALPSLAPLSAQEEEYRRVEKQVKEQLRILEGLEHGVEALKRLGRARDEAHMREIAEGVRKKIARLRASLGVPREKRGGGDRSEAKVAQAELRRMRLAFEALMAAERRDEAELLEHALHARELALEKRRDEKAMRIRESAPNRGAQAELLMLGAELLREQGKRKLAVAVLADAEQLLQRHHRERDSKGERRARDAAARERERAEGRSRGRRESGDRIENLERRVENIEKMLEEIVAHIRGEERKKRHESDRKRL